MLEPRYQPQGSLFQADGSVEWRVSAPRSERVALVIGSEADQQREIIMTPEPFGFHAVRQAKISDGTRYSYKLADGNAFPDPASRSQPDGVHRPSAVFSPAFYWTDGRWPGVDRRDLVFYELHVGTFTCEGTFDAIIPRLDELKSLGVTAVELMPIAQFPGERNWGYDGVYPYAPQNSYGGPRALQRLVDSAHACGLALFLDVVYNHLGPEGCYVNQFGPYFTDHYHTPWGSAINFGDAQSDPVRQFFIDNAVTWIRDFHIDGLRLDAVHAIYDASAQHILAEISTAVHNAGREQNRTVHVVAESNLNDVRIVTPVDRGGYGLDGAWSDDFHHAVHALLTGERDGYYQDFGEAEQLVKALDSVYVYDGCYSPFRRRRHGETVGHTDRTKFVVALQNHDQIGNRAGRSPHDAIAADGPAARCWPRVFVAVRATVVHGRRIRRNTAVPLFLLVRRCRARRSDSRRTKTRVRRLGLQMAPRNSRRSIPSNVRVGEARMVVAGRIAAIQAAPALSGFAASAP